MNNYHFCISATLILFMLSSTISCLSPYENHLKHAAAAYSNGNYDEAIAEFTKIIEINPDDASSYSWRGSCYYYKGQYDLAIDDFTRAISLKDNRLDKDYNSRGLSYSAKGDYYSAISDFAKAIEIYPSPLYYNNRGLAYGRFKNHDLAIQDFTVAIQLAPRDARPYSNRADSYIATGQNSLAIVDLRKVIEFSFNDQNIRQSATERLRSLGVIE